MSSWPLIIQQQIVKPLQTRAGSFSLLVSLGVWVLLLYYPIRNSAKALSSDDGAVRGILNMLGLDNLPNWPLAELGAYWALCLYVLPLFAIFAAADQMISERQRGGLRFLLLRVTRSQLFFGRLIGQLSLQALILITTLISATLMGVLRLDNYGFFSQQLTLLFTTVIQLFIVVMPFIALMSLLSVALQKARSATMLAMVLSAFGERLFLWLGSKVPGLDLFAYLIPGNQLSDMVNTLPYEAWPWLIFPIFQTLVFAIGGYLLFRRQAV